MDQTTEATEKAKTFESFVPSTKPRTLKFAFSVSSVSSVVSVVSVFQH